MIIKTNTELYFNIRNNWIELNRIEDKSCRAKNCQLFVKWIQQHHGTVHFLRTYYPHRQLLRDLAGLVEGVDYIEFKNEACYNMFILKCC